MLAARRGGFLLYARKAGQVGYPDADEEGVVRRNGIEVREAAVLVHHQHNPGVIVGVAEELFRLHGGDGCTDFLVEGETGFSLAV